MHPLFEVSPSADNVLPRNTSIQRKVAHGRRRSMVCRHNYLQASVSEAWKGKKASARLRTGKEGNGFVSGRWLPPYSQREARAALHSSHANKTREAREPEQSARCRTRPVDGIQQVGLPWGPLVATKHTKPPRSAKEPAHPSKAPTQTRRKKRASQNRVRGAGQGKTGRVAGRRSLEVPPSTEPDGDAPSPAAPSPYAGTHTLRGLETALRKGAWNCHVTTSSAYTAHVICAHVICAHVMLAIPCPTQTPTGRTIYPLASGAKGPSLDSKL